MHIPSHIRQRFSTPGGVKARLSPANRCRTRSRKISQFKHYPMDAPI